MKQPVTLTAAILATALLSGTIPVQSQTTTKSSSPSKRQRRPAAKRRVETASERQIHELREMMASQQAQIDALKGQLATRDQQVATAQDSATAAQTQAAAAVAAAQTVATQSAQTTTELQQVKSNVADLQVQNTTLTETVVNNQAQTSEAINSPATLHYKGVTITPVAFFALEGVWRQRSVNSDINTPFNSIPLPSANEGHVSELNLSGRQSRLGALIAGNAGKFTLSGYFEADFLGTGTSSNNNQSNSYVLRQRQIWGQAATAKGFAVTGGQMWSLVTENGLSTNNRTEKLPNTIDPQYMVGFNWTRQPGLRLQQRFGQVRTGQFTMAMSLEQAQITGFNVASSVTAAIPTDFYFAGPGQNGGLYNAAGNIGNGNTASTGGITTYANNTAPDVIVKGTLDYPKAHLELGGIARFLRDFYFPILTAGGTAAAPTYTYSTAEASNTKTAGGVFGSVRVSPSKYADLAFQAMAGPGVGRYGSSQLTDATLRPDGTLEPVKNYHGLFSLETHPNKKLDVYGYYGGEYAQRTVYTTPQGDTIGYGVRNLNDTGCYALPVSPGSAGGSAGSIAAQNCASPTRYIQEGMLGFTYRVVNSPKYGQLRYQFTYSYLQRNLWSGSSTGTNFPTGARAEDNMIHAGMRYYIP